MGNLGKSLIHVSMVIALLGGTAWAGPQGRSKRAPYLKQGAVVPMSECIANRSACVCEPGTLPRSFVAHTGIRYRQCAPARCPTGKVLHEKQTPGGKYEYSCVAMKSVPYTEPSPKPKAKKPARRGK